MNMIQLIKINASFQFTFIVALLIFLPFIIWNLNNDLAFVRNQGSHIYRGGGITEFINLWLGLAIISGPLFFYYSIIRPFLNLKEWRKTSEPIQYFTVVTIVPLGYFLAHSLFSKFELNWPAPVFLSGVFLLSLQLNRNNMKTYYAQIIYSLILIMIITTQTFWPVLPLKGNADITNRYYTYSALQLELAEYLQQNPNLKQKQIMANNFQIPSIINFYLKPELEAGCLSIGYHETLYSFLYPDNKLKGQDFLFLTEGKKMPKWLYSYFENIKFLENFESKRGTHLISEYTLWWVENYRGKDL